MKAVRAIWEDQVIAETDHPIVVEGNYYFPAKDVKFNFLKPSETTTHCPWKGEANYYNVVVDNNINKDAAWVYSCPSEEAKRLENYYAFWNGVKIEKLSSKQRASVIAESVKSFIQRASKLNTNEDYEFEFSHLLSTLGNDILIHSLPEKFIENQSLFNFQNSNNPCFYANHSKIITYINPTLKWELNQISQIKEHSLENLLNNFEIIEGGTLDEIFNVLVSHGWVHVPKARILKNNRWTYYTLDIAIAKHGEKETLQGFQGQFTNITHEVELSLSLIESQTNMKSLLAGLKEGLFFFDRLGNVASERSQSLSTILKGDDNFESIFSFLKKFLNVEKDTVSSVLELLWPHDNSDFYSDFKTSVSILPNKFSLKSDDKTRFIEVEYRPLYDNENRLDKVIVIVDDVTERKEKEKEVRSQSERVKRISKAASNSESYQSFTEECKIIIYKIGQFFANNNDDYPSVKRNLHTLKGALSTFNFFELSSDIHTIEESFVNFNKIDERLAKLWHEVEEKWIRQTKDIATVLGLNSAMNEVLVQKPKILQIAKYAFALGDADFLKIVNNLFERSPRIVFAKYIEYINFLNQKNPHKRVRVEVLNNSEEVSFKETQVLDGAFVHIFRNCFDHGIECIENRIADKKEEFGTIYIGVYREGDFTRYVIRDDGSGIDGDKLALKAKDLGFWTEEQFNNATWEQKIHLIFVPNLSSKDSVSDVSGRGVGMDAVKDIVESLEGDIIIKSESGKGTIFEILIPSNKNYLNMVA